MEIKKKDFHETHDHTHNQQNSFFSSVLHTLKPYYSFLRINPSVEKTYISTCEK